MSPLEALFRRTKLERELEAELRLHLEMEAEENRRRGLSEEDANLAAIRSFGGVDPGFRSTNVVSLRVSLAFDKYREHSRVREFFERVLERVESAPAVQSAAVVSSVPLHRSWLFEGPLEIEGVESAPAAPPIASVHMGSDRYFETLGLSMLSGRNFCETDDESAPRVAIVNAALMRNFFRGRDPIGMRLSLDGGKSWASVVGVVADVRHHRLDADAPEMVYLPFTQHPEYTTNVLLRAASDPLRLAEEVRAAVHAVDPDQPVDDVVTLDDVRQGALAKPRLLATLLALFALVALVVTASGIAGVVAYAVTERRKELAIRIALGARPRSVLAGVLRDALVPVVFGLAVGLLGVLAIGGHLIGMLYRVTANDPLTLAAASLLFLAVGAAACVGPARRAVLTDPLMTLRSD